nr:ATPase 9, plasma membrane-type isoform X1 [Tanacetum cinerariifolium]
MANVSTFFDFYNDDGCQVHECRSAWKTRLELDEIVKFFSQAGITDMHFLLFNPVEKRTTIAYIDQSGNWQGVTKRPPEQIVELCNLSRPVEELIEKAYGFSRVFPGFDVVAFFIPGSQLGPFMSFDDNHYNYCYLVYTVMTFLAKESNVAHSR